MDANTVPLGKPIEDDAFCWFPWDIFPDFCIDLNEPIFIFGKTIYGFNRTPGDLRSEKIHKT